MQQHHIGALADFQPGLVQAQDLRRRGRDGLETGAHGVLPGHLRHDSSAIAPADGMARRAARLLGPVPIASSGHVG